MTSTDPIDTWTAYVELDNFRPVARETTTVRGSVHEMPGHRETVVLSQTEGLKDPTASIYLLDDGDSVRPHYVAGWHPVTGDLYLHPFPLSQGTRPDNGRPVDMSGWALGPRRCYHLKISRPRCSHCGAVLPAVGEDCPNYGYGEVHA
jgi:hypothetical protein